MLACWHEGTHTLFSGESKNFGLTEIIDAFTEIQKTSILDKEQKLQFFLNLKRIYGRTALLLSGGGLFGLFHSGVIKTLLKEDLMPSVLSGSSGGSLICALLAVTKKEDALEVLTT